MRWENFSGISPPQVFFPSQSWLTGFRPVFSFRNSFSLFLGDKRRLLHVPFLFFRLNGQSLLSPFPHCCYILPFSLFDPTLPFEKSPLAFFFAHTHTIRGRGRIPSSSTPGWGLSLLSSRPPPKRMRGKGGWGRRAPLFVSLPLSLSLKAPSPSASALGKGEEEI